MSPAPRRRQLTADDYFAGVRDRNLSVFAQALTVIESSSPRHRPIAEELLTRLLPFTGDALRIGITGVPGVGKSTFIEALGMHLVRRGLQVAVLAVDPSSGVSGGSILGDKTRMNELASEVNAFIRPSPAAGTLGGVANKTRETMFVAEAAGYDVVLVETVGVGQSETMVCDMTDCFLALMLPGAGDELQGIKRGLLELADVIAVNKADGDNRKAAELAARQYHTALESLTGHDREKAPTILTCSARDDAGIEAVWEAIETKCQMRRDRGEFIDRRQRQNLRWLWALVDEHLRRAIHTHSAVKQIYADIEQQVLLGQMPAAAGARQIFAALGLE
ncbi:methylmalonyl Co-A mutase-associated GTPase MeaB [Novipirellula artificiosorum]|uniref:Putative GTPase n=1 Tax=Novipirellula artificiosorum TaxID=2528016 RepID=A0A5C6E2C3_9BACT|nr:methylmalonyl Co-A mutase-associated GTPase MeaB [Novipirellula artificiosorum]TWU42875.1 putative GTPase [Novipirellula artificiosorum]